MSHGTEALRGIAIVGASGRIPGAATLAAFWENLVNWDYVDEMFQKAK